MLKQGFVKFAIPIKICILMVKIVNAINVILHVIIVKVKVLLVVLSVEMVSKECQT